MLVQCEAVGCIDVDSSLEMKVNIMYLTTSFHVVATLIQLVFAQKSVGIIIPWKASFMRTTDT